MYHSAAYEFPFFSPLRVSEDSVYEFVEAEFGQFSPDIKQTMYGIIHLVARAGGVAMPRGKGTYSRKRGGKQINHATAIKAQDTLAKRGYIDIQKGRRAMNGFEKGIATKLKPTPKFHELFSTVDLTKPLFFDPEAHPIVTLDREPFKGDLLSVNGVFEEPVTAQEVWRTAAITDRLNRGYFNQMNLEYLLEEGEDRIPAFSANPFFTAMFSKDGGGRLYQRTPSYQNMKGEDRRKLLLNGTMLDELDFPSMHINLAYAIIGKQNPHPDDSYTPVLERVRPVGDDPELRGSVKKAIIIGFNTPNVSKLVAAYRYNHPREFEVLQRHGIGTPAEIYYGFLKENPELKEIFEQERIISREIMFYESRVMLNILEKLEKKGILSLPLHDAVLIPSTEVVEVGSIMNDAYEQVTGNKIEVKVK